MSDKKEDRATENGENHQALQQYLIKFKSIVMKMACYRREMVYARIGQNERAIHEVSLQPDKDLSEAANQT